MYCRQIDAFLRRRVWTPKMPLIETSPESGRLRMEAKCDWTRLSPNPARQLYWERLVTFYASPLSKKLQGRSTWELGIRKKKSRGKFEAKVRLRNGK